MSSHVVSSVTEGTRRCAKCGAPFALARRANGDWSRAGYCPACRASIRLGFSGTRRGFRSGGQSVDQALRRLRDMLG